jgi:hypothetical protein
VTPLVLTRRLACGNSGQDPAVDFWKSVRVKTANNSRSEAFDKNSKITFSVLAL